jgi:hypothetical protein
LLLLGTDSRHLLLLLLLEVLLFGFPCFKPLPLRF